MEENPYAPPKAEVAEAPDTKSDGKPSVGARFVWTLCIGFPVYFFFVLFLPREAWIMGALGSVMFAAFSGLIAMCIPVKPKVGFILPALLIGVVLAYMLGKANGG